MYKDLEKTKTVNVKIGENQVAFVTPKGQAVFNSPDEIDYNLVKSQVSSDEPEKFETGSESNNKNKHASNKYTMFVEYDKNNPNITKYDGPQTIQNGNSTVQMSGPCYVMKGKGSITMTFK